MRPRGLWVYALPLYVLGLNSFLAPGAYDDAIYYGVARRFADGLGYGLPGLGVINRGPVLSLLLAPFLAMGVRSLFALKAILLLAMVAAGHAAERRLRDVHPAATLLAWLLPALLVSGTRLMAEGLFLALSLAFLSMLERLREDRRVTTAIGAGALLALAILTRYAGVFLAAAVIYQALLRKSSPPPPPPEGEVPRSGGGGGFAPAHELVTLGVAAMPVGAWLVWARQNRAGTFTEDLRNNALYQLGVPADGGGWSLGEAIRNQATSAWSITRDLNEVLGLHTAVQRALHLEGPLGIVLVVAWVLVVLGMRATWAQPERRAEVIYVATSLVALSISGWLDTRYLVPLAPMLVAYVIDALRSWFPPRVVPAALAAWGAVLLAMDGVLLFGDVRELHGPWSGLVAQSPEEFYRGQWLEMYELLDPIRGQPGDVWGFRPAALSYFAEMEPDPWAPTWVLSDAVVACPSVAQRSSFRLFRCE
jgi:hypothetical protein